MNGIRNSNDQRGGWAFLLTVLWMSLDVGGAHALCLDPLGDITDDLSTNVVDVQCSILTTLWTLSGENPTEVPGCCVGEPTRADVNCVEGINVSDVLLVVQLALDQPLSTVLDEDGSGCPDACEEPGAICGNGILEEGEECDDGLLNSDVAPDICRADCTLPACGDGVEDSDEECDNGQLNSDTNADACRTSCELPGCGDGVVDGGEQCDGGPDCNSDCQFTGGSGECGNGIEEEGEECDEGELNSDIEPDSCRSDCSLPGCGDGVLDSDESCDNGPLNSDSLPDACRTSCFPASCGDLVVDSGETCDNGLENSDTLADACRTSCQLAGCGDGVLDTGEECDAGEDNSDILPDSCRTTCEEAGCGDGVVDLGEECDGTPDCAAICVFDTGVCGDGIVQFGEECDGTPGCAENCTLETTFTPQPGDLVISELMINGMTGESWIEIFNVSAFEFDLGGMALTDNGTDSHVIGFSLGIPAGTAVVLGNAAANAMGESLPVDYVFSDFALESTEDEVILFAGAIELDRVEYSTAGGYPVTVGVAMSLDAAQMTVTGNDVADSWCGAALAYSESGFGTPGVQNPPCPVCGNGFVEPGEDCEPSLALPTENCTAECILLADPVCGNGIVETGETCDNGPANSNTEPDACRLSCELPYCGDLVVDSGEDCDAFFGCTESCVFPLPDSVFPGDLVITEFMPEGLQTSGSGSWFELYNASSNAIDLIDLIVYDLGEDYFELAFENPPLMAPGEYLVFGTNTDPATNGGLDVDVEMVGMALDLDEDEIILVHTVEVDRIAYGGDAEFPLLEGSSVTLSNTLTDYVSNDDPISWCPGEATFGTGGLGSPGSANAVCPVCGDGVLEGFEECDNGGLNSDTAPDACRLDCKAASCGDGVVDSGEGCDGVAGCTTSCSLLAVQEGALVITEVMVDPSFAPDAVGEWFEVLNTSGESLNLTAMVIRDDGGDFHQVPEDAELVIGPGQFMLFGLSDDTQVNGGIDVDYVYEGVTLDSSADELVIEFGTTEVDRFAWDAGFEIVEGASLNLDAGSMDAVSNDDVFSWCQGLVLFGAGEYGTPGAGNVSCADCGNGIFELGEQCDQGILNSDTEPDACRTDCTLPGCGDGVTDSGEECDGNPLFCSEQCLFIIEVKPGDVVITEIMNNPEGFSDAEGEWFEVINVTGDTLDLEGIWLVDDGTDFHTVESGGPLLIEPGERFVFGSNGDFTTNGGVIVDYAFDPSQFTMSNGSDEVVVSSLGVEVDRVAYDGGVTFPDQAGYAMNLENFLFDDVSNDFGDNWCLASSSYGGLNFGTPGADNDDCPVCGNNIVEPGEECDDGNVTPFDGCEQDCSLTVFDVCGNGIIEGNEVCDDGTGNSDTLPDACRTSCVPAFCGDGVVDSGEACDGGPGCAGCELEGSTEPGDIIVSEIMIYPLVASPELGRWFEVYNPSASDINLHNWTVSDDGGESHVISAPTGLVVAAGGFVVFGLSADPAVTGGLIPDYVLTEFTLDEEDEIVLSVNGQEIDRVNYSLFNGFNFPSGASLLADLFFVDAFINDFGSVWCASSSVYGSAGAGTPGADNDTCPVCGDGIIQPGEECDDENSIGGDGCDFACNLEGTLPSAGDLVVTEIMIDPKLSEDEDGEWFEIECTAAEAVNLQGLVLTDQSGGTDTVDLPLLMNPGDRFVFGANVSPSANGQVALNWKYTGLSFDNAIGLLELSDSSGALIDEITWGASSPLTEGAALSLHPGLTSATDNDIQTNWCSASTTLGNGDFGSPGAENPPCPF